MDGKGFRRAIAPTGLGIDKVEFAAGQMLITGRSRSLVSICPNCCRPSTRVYNRYYRALTDLHREQLRHEQGVEKLRD
jgi:hypothetical protein